MAAGDFGAARRLLEKAVTAAPGNVALWLNLAGACRALSDFPGAMTAVNRALKAHPRSFAALLMKGSLLERQGEVKEAARFYGFAVALQPPEDVLDPATARALRHAHEVNARYVEELVAFVAAEIGTVAERGASIEARRINQFMDYALRRKPIYRQEPSQFHYPGLPAIEFYEREQFPWLAEFEAATPAIKRELEEVLQGGFGRFVPYVNYEDHVPLDQWHELNHSTRWGAFHLYLAGQRVEENCRLCPQTLAALAELPQPQMPKRSPAAMFSALQPRTHIPPHTGVANTRLVVHLPLIVPEGCGFRVGNEVREWCQGEAWIFDDTIEHEAWNRGENARVILICDVWNPYLSVVERDTVVAVVAAMDRFNGTVPDEGL
jgi:aspartyl/asparaginyl beta-hydroxylase (cupin superfamily)